MYYVQQKSKKGTVSVLFIVAKNNHEILTALHYKPLYNTSRKDKRGKKYTNSGLQWCAYGA